MEPNAIDAGTYGVAVIKIEKWKAEIVKKNRLSFQKKDFHLP